MEITLTTPLTAALTKFLQASLCVDVHQQALADHVVERLEREIRIDRARAVADEQREMMHFARFAGFQHQADPRARAFANQMMMQPATASSAGIGAISWSTPRSDRIRMFTPASMALVARAHKIVHRLGQARLAVGGLEQNRQRDRLEARPG